MSIYNDGCKTYDRSIIFIKLGEKLMQKIFSYLFLLFYLFILLSCRLDTESLTTVDTLARNIPNIVIEKVVYKELEDNQLTQEVRADEFRVFSQEDLVQVTQGQVKTYRDGESELEGQANLAEYNQNTEDANVMGPIEVYYHPEETRITADKLDWIKKDRLLTSSEDSLVEVEQDNGTNFQGKNFSVDMRTKTVSYGKEVTGKLYAEARENQAAEDSQEDSPK